MNSRVLFLAVVVLVLALGVGLMVYDQDSSSTATATTTIPTGVEPSSSAVNTAEVVIEDMALGNPMAQIQVVEYASFTCPHCAAFHTNAFESLRKNYIDTGKIRFVFREVYFDQFGLVASMIGRCSGKKEDYFQFVDKVFNQQKQWMASRDGNTVLNELIALGKSVGLTDEQLQACLSDDAKSERLVSWYQQNAKADGIRSTPSFLVNGKLMSNMSYEEFAKVLDNELGL